MHDRDVMIEKVLEGLREGLTEEEASKKAGCSYPTWHRWKQEVPGLSQRQAEAKLSRIGLIEDALYKAALSGKVLACLAILEKEDRSWRERAREIAPQQQTFVFNGGAAAILSLLTPKMKQDLLVSMVSHGHLPTSIKQIEGNTSNGNGSNGNGHEPH